MFLSLLEFVLYTIFVAILATQVIYPLWHGTKLFPMFRKRHKLEQNVTEVKETLDEVRIEKTVEEIQKQIEKEKKK